jgi:hypothetical protein
MVALPEDLSKKRWPQMDANSRKFVGAWQEAVSRCLPMELSGEKEEKAKHPSKLAAVNFKGMS